MSQVEEFGNFDLAAVMSANAPAAMYFVISVLPISITSGTLPPASVASNFCRWVFHCWYWTLTVTPGCCASNALFAAATTVGQPDCASTCSQTVMLSAVVFFVAPNVAAVTAAAATADETESDDDASLHLEASRVRRPCRSLAPVTAARESSSAQLVNTTRHCGEILAHR